MSPDPVAAVPTDNVFDDVLFIVPAFNEAANIASVIEDLMTIAPPGNIVVVNDGSKDNTAEIAGRYPIRVVDMPFNMGVSMALRTGFQNAMVRGAKMAVQFDGDGQHVAREIERIVSPVARGECDVAVGVRLADQKSTSTLPRMIGSAALRILLRILTGSSYADPTSGFRAYSEDAIVRFVHHFPDDYPEVEGLVLAHKLHLRVREYPVQMRRRLGGRSSITFLSSIYYMVKVALASIVIVLRRY
ncbi:MAG: glycosyltransferase family 2 protein [Deltaproteobacteria bacterium]|nr:glycosyltransferase family 2 protein [Deltaproteobacteria bacterium]